MIRPSPASRAGRVAFGLLLLVLAAACGPEEEGPVEDPLANVRDTLGEDTTLSEGAVRGPPVPVDEEPDTSAMDALRYDEDQEDLALPAWTVERMQWAPDSPPRPPVIEEVRWGRSEGYDRWVVELDDDVVPGYSVEYVDRPLHECGSGRQIHPEGDGWLQLRMEPVHGHTEEGEATVEREVETPSLDLGLRIYRTCDFEAVVTLVLAVRSPEPFRAFHLRDPVRIAVDVRR